MEIAILQGKNVIFSSNADWQAFSANALSMDDPIDNVPNLIYSANSKAPSVLKIVRHLMWINRFRFVSGGMLFYDTDGGAYRKVSPEEEAACALQFFSPEVQQMISTGSMKETLSRLRNIPHLNLRPDELNHDMNLINIRNGVLDIQSGQLSVKSSAFNFDYILDVEFYPNVTWDDCPTFANFCGSSLQGDSNRIKLLLQILGYLWSSVWGAKKAFIFLGAPNCGKSVMAELIKKVLGQERVSNVPLHKLGDRFNIAVLYGKSVNICAEVRSTPLKNLDTFKAIVGGDTLSAEFKGRDPFSFSCRTKLLFCCNALPSFGEVEVSEAVVDRLCVLFFPHGIKPEERDPLLLEKLFAERSAIFSLSMIALRGLIKQNLAFDIPAESQQIIDEFTREENHLDEFISGCCELSEAFRIPTASLYEHYCDFCASNCIHPFPIKAFVAHLKREANITSIHARFDGGQPLRGFAGIRLLNSQA